MSPAAVVKGKSVESARYRRLIRTIVIAVLLLPAFALVWNLDIVLRACRALIDGKFTVQRFRYDLASLDLGRPASVIPVDKRASPVDGMVQVLIPAGEFTMGKRGEADVDSPPHPVFLDAFWMDRVEVSNAMFEKCVQEKGCTRPVISENHYYGNWIYRDYPIVYVNWYQAKAYCEWTGRRLPTEAEWEKAARGTDERKYPWGNAKPNPYLANYAESLIGEAVPVYRYPLGASPFGALNMVGNVREWVADWFEVGYYSESPYTNPLGPETGSERSMRSGAYDAEANEIYVTSRYKHQPQSAGLSRGFRCAETAE